MEVYGYIGALDIGTSSVRGLLFDTDAEPVPGIEVHLPYSPKVGADGTYETDASRLFSLVGSAVDGLLHQAGPRRRSRIQAIGVSTFWHGLLAADEKAHPLTPLYLWADTRSWRQSDQLRERIDPEAIHQRTGCLVHPTYWPAKLLWLKEGQPDLWKRRPRLLSFWDLVHQRLFGKPVTGVSMASGTGLLELAGSSWDAPLLKLLDVRREQLPDLGEAGQGLVHQYANRWPDLASVPWVCAAGDGALANLGSNCVDHRQRALTVGTSGALRVLYPGLPDRVPAGLWCYRLDSKRVVVGGALSNGGNLYAWMTRTLAIEPAALERQLRGLKPASTGLTFVPLLAGERSPGFASHATGSIAGLTQATTPVEIVRAGLEATAIEFARVDRLLDSVLPGARRLIANGAGLLASPSWMQIMADAIGKPVAASLAREASSRGAAIFAGEHIGALDSKKLKAQVGRTYAVNRDAQAAYEVAADRQAELYRLLVHENRLDAILKGPTATGGKR
ncbi:MAG TPA: gluconokinase [Candidatus Dormibacteraeota bacterium]|nr:gluconokinase [Candidatus Dormibacteraeota bacterium]